MDQRQLSRGTKLFFGAPASPMPPERSAAIAEAVAQVAGIVEAHLPQCFIEGDDEARQILVIVVAAKSDIAQIAANLSDLLSAALPDGRFIDILPFRESELPSGVRQAKCKIYPRTQSPWWKIW
jgi:hypothetical protein